MFWVTFLIVMIVIFSIIGVLLQLLWPIILVLGLVVIVGTLMNQYRAQKQSQETWTFYQKNQNQSTHSRQDQSTSTGSVIEAEYQQREVDHDH